MYKVETLKKYLTIARDAFARVQSNPAGVYVHISRGNRKIGRVMNVSTAPVLACANCKECKSFCYDIKACMQYPCNVLTARVENLYMARYARRQYFQQIKDACSRRRANKFFRWHVAGDILDADYFVHMVEIARMFPDFVFWTYTKNYAIVNHYVATHGGNRHVAIPGNLSIMFSEWDGLEMDNPYNFGTFSCKLKDGNKNHAPEYFDGLYKCPGNCDICKVAGRGCLVNENTYADEH